MLFTVLLYLGLGSVFTQDRICLVDGRKSHEEEYEDSNADNHDGKRDQAPSDQTQQIAHLDPLSFVGLTVRQGSSVRAEERGPSNLENT